MKKIFAIFLLSLLCACAATPVYKPLPTAAASTIKGTDVVLSIPQKEIIAEIVPSTAGAAGGLIGALIDVSIDAARSKAAESAITPLRDSLLSFNAETSVQNAVDRMIKPLPLIADGSVAASKESSNELDKRLKESKKDAVLFVSVSYSLSPDFKTFKVSGVANLIPNTDALRKMQYGLYKESSKINDPEVAKTHPYNALYHNSFTCTRLLDVAADGLPAAASAWAENNGQRATRALQDGIDTVVAMLAADLQKQVATIEAKPAVQTEVVKLTLGDRNVDANRATDGSLSVAN